MKSISRSMMRIVGCMLLLGASGAFAQDWPQWRGAARDGRAAAFC